MTIYQFPPMKNHTSNPVGFVWQEDVFTNEELNKIIKIGDNLPSKFGTINKDKDKDKDEENFKRRKCFTSWIKYDEETNFIYTKLADFISFANAKYYQFSLFGFLEDFQYTVYDDSESHYDWHLDLAPSGDTPTRKLSCVLQLTDPSEYEGGELELLTSPIPQQMVKKRGMIHVFPSYLLHRVTPVTKGTRKTLVVWVNGERFK